MTTKTKGRPSGQDLKAMHRAAPGRLKFGAGNEFHHAVRREVQQYFEETGRRPRDCPGMYLKSGLIFAALVISYGLLVFAAAAWWQALPLASVLGLAMAAVGFNIQHDGGHGAYSKHRWINKLAALTLDLLGGSSYVWARKHNSIHHSYTNVTDHDDDINVGVLGRLSPHQKRLTIHRLQHLYMWFLYGFLPLKWHAYDDFQNVISGRIGGHRIPRPRGRDLATFIGGKAIFFSLAFGLPMLLHPWWYVLTLYGLATFVQGVALSVVFQMAHCVEEAAFPLPRGDTGRIESNWAAHQVETTVDFAPRSWWLTWFVGGLNYQIEHHLFPQICHTNYPAIAPIVEKVSADFGLKYTAHKTLWAGIASHFRWLRRMGVEATPCANLAA